MSEYIKREDAERLLRYDFLSALTEDERVDELNRIPSADVVEVVRCKDCKYRQPVKDCMFGECMYAASMVADDDYCSNGELKEARDE